MRLSLTDAERLALAEFGVTEDTSGVLRSDDGAEVGAGTAVLLLKNGQPRHPDTGQFVPRDHPAAYASPSDFGMPEPRRIAEPGQLSHGYLEAGHAADSPAVTDFTRGPLVDGLQADPPGSDPSGAEEMPGGTPASDRLAAMTEQRAANYSQSVQQRLTTSAMPMHGPATSRAVMTPDMGAANVPAARTVQATRPAPGEQR